MNPRPTAEEDLVGRSFSAPNWEHAVLTDASGFPADWPVELRFLVLCLRKALGTATDASAEPAAGEIDWDAWLG